MKALLRLYEEAIEEDLALLALCQLFRRQASRNSDMFGVPNVPEMVLKKCREG